jgi:hypothetical protein
VLGFSESRELGFYPFIALNFDILFNMMEGTEISGRSDIPPTPIDSSSHRQKAEKSSDFLSRNALVRLNRNCASLALLVFTVQQFYYFGTLLIPIKALKHMFGISRQTRSRYCSHMLSMSSDRILSNFYGF